MVEVEERALGALEQDVLAARRARPGRARSCRRGGRAGARPRRAPARRAASTSNASAAHRAEQQVLVGQHALEPLAQDGAVEQVLHPQPEPPRPVAVGRPDPAPGRADLGRRRGAPRCARSRATWYGMITCALRLTRTRATSMPRAVEHVELVDERHRVDHDAVADDRRDVRVEHARRRQVELEDLVAADDGVAGVVAALVAHDHRDLLGQEVGRLALALVAPLQPDDHGGRHQRARRIGERPRIGAGASRRRRRRACERAHPRCVSEPRSRQRPHRRPARRHRQTRPWVWVLVGSVALTDGRCALQARSLTSWFAGRARSCRGRPEYSSGRRDPDGGPGASASSAGTSGTAVGTSGRSVQTTARSRSLVSVMRLLGVLALVAPVMVGILFLSIPDLTASWVVDGLPRSIVAAITAVDARRGHRPPSCRWTDRCASASAAWSRPPSRSPRGDYTVAVPAQRRRPRGPPRRARSTAISTSLADTPRPGDDRPADRRRQPPGPARRPVRRGRARRALRATAVRRVRRHRPLQGGQRLVRPRGGRRRPARRRPDDRREPPRQRPRSAATAARNSC